MGLNPDILALGVKWVKLFVMNECFWKWGSQGDCILVQLKNRKMQKNKIKNDCQWYDHQTVCLEESNLMKKNWKVKPGALGDAVARVEKIYIIDYQTNNKTDKEHDRRKYITENMLRCNGNKDTVNSLRINIHEEIHGVIWKQEVCHSLDSGLYYNLSPALIQHKQKTCSVHCRTLK